MLPWPPGTSYPACMVAYMSETEDRYDPATDPDADEPGPREGHANDADPAADSTGAYGSSADADARVVRNRHDLFFKSVVGKPQNAMSLLADALPPEIVAEMKLEQLRPIPTEVISPILQEREMDLAFTVPAGDGEVLVHFLVDVEHQNRDDPLMAFRCWLYAALMTDAWVKAHPGTTRVPPVISLVVHQGAKGAWASPPRLVDIYDLDPGTLARIGHRLYAGEYALDDLGAADVQALGARSLTRQMIAAFLVLKFEPRARALYDDLLARREVLQGAARESGGADLLLGLYSYLDSSPKITGEELVKLYDELGPEAQEAAVTMAQMYQTRGRASMLLELLTQKFGSVAESVTKTVNDGSESDLKTWGSRVLAAESLEDVFR